MKLRNKKTGEVINKLNIRIHTLQEPYIYTYKTLSDFVNDWEDCE